MLSRREFNWKAASVLAMAGGALHTPALCASSSHLISTLFDDRHDFPIAPPLQTRSLSCATIDRIADTVLARGASLNDWNKYRDDDAIQLRMLASTLKKQQDQISSQEQRLLSLPSFTLAEMYLTYAGALVGGAASVGAGLYLAELAGVGIATTALAATAPVWLIVGGASIFISGAAMYLQIIKIQNNSDLAPTFFLSWANHRNATINVALNTVPKADQMNFAFKATRIASEALTILGFGFDAFQSIRMRSIEIERERNKIRMRALREAHNSVLDVLDLAQRKPDELLEFRLLCEREIASKMLLGLRSEDKYLACQKPNTISATEGLKPLFKYEGM